MSMGSIAFAVQLYGLLERDRTIEANKPIEGDKPAKHRVFHLTPPSSECPTESGKSVSVQTETHEVYTPSTLWPCFFGLILHCEVMICSLFQIQFGLAQLCDRAWNGEKGSMVLKFGLGIRWTLSDLMPRWVILGISFLPLSVLLAWVIVYILDWGAIAGKSYRLR